MYAVKKLNGLQILVPSICNKLIGIDFVAISSASFTLLYPHLVNLGWFDKVYADGIMIF
jgi:hypothetical protein